MSLTGEDLEKSAVVIVIDQNGDTYVKLPKDENIEFDSRAYTKMVNTLTVLEGPSFVLSFFLWVERKMQSLNKVLFGGL